MSEKHENSESVENTEKTAQELLIEKLAAEELLREASRGAIRAEAVGPSGWLKCPLVKTNKTFLKNTIRHAVSSNNYHSSRKHPYNGSSVKSGGEEERREGRSYKQHRKTPYADNYKRK